jgi:anion-transporting  ArsA/GET3 family ATPase
MMLDAGETFDELILENAKSRSVADAILRHRIYRYLSRHLAGTQSFMAMEKVLAVERDSRFDLVVLDTPPSERALDFFDAPERMLEILESPLTTWLGRAANWGDRLSLGILKKAATKTLSSLGQVTGGGFLTDVGEFLADLSELLGGFRARAERVQARLRSPDVGYGLVFSPHNLSLSGALNLARGLKERNISLENFILNRLPDAPTYAPSELDDAVQAELLARGYSEHEQLALRASYAEAHSRRALAEAAGEELREKLCSSPQSHLYFLSTLTEPIHSVQGLVLLAETLRRVERRA